VEGEPMGVAEFERLSGEDRCELRAGNPELYRKLQEESRGPGSVRRRWARQRLEALREKMTAAVDTAVATGKMPADISSADLRESAALAEELGEPTRPEMTGPFSTGVRAPRAGD